MGKNDFLRFAEVLVVTFALTSVFFWVPAARHGKPVSMEELSPTERLFWMTGTGSGLEGRLESPQEL